MKKGVLDRFRRLNVGAIPEDPAKPVQSFFIKALKIAFAAGIGFYKDECV